ncbi:MAG TPA: QsdR family transcriptional regulator [Noviherbaspirillum sp.]|jgi:AcrR family transcriptional regulator|uniref:QsdR family transcriptional regulator n=1 Tax=Noviherbaspirillum sp. TaxID=1926288 RepID=UPI002DDD6E1A|nr:QsdR family transcriptional regulator [Noviherbaspirillum sp.]HEV2608632.1 QsdR family transcriptional regulator [Noviherbaspirillum sp.]
MADSRLAATRQSKPPEAGKPTRDDLIALVKTTLIEGRRLDMVALATELGIGRATLYRWAGDREQLLNEVFGHFLQDTFQWIESKLEAQHLRGADLILGWVDYMMRALSKSPPVRSLLRNEQDLALRIMMGKGKEATSMQAMVLHKLDSVIRQEVAAGRYTPRLDPTMLAQIVIRLTDGIYSDMLGGAEVEHAEVLRIVRGLLDGTSAP